MDPLIYYLHDGTLPQDQKEANQIRKRSQWFLPYEGFLYKRAFALSLLRCTTLKDEKSVATKVLRTGYYWPTLRVVAIEMVKKCDKCQ